MGYKYDGAEAEDDFGQQKTPQRVEVIPDALKSVLLEVSGYLAMLIKTGHAPRAEAIEIQDKIARFLV